MTMSERAVKGWYICDGCGQPFQYSRVRKGAKFCSAACKVKASRRRRATAQPS